MPIKHKINPHVLDDIAAKMLTLSSQQEMKHFLEEILTNTELYDLTKRWELLQMLADGFTQRKIAQELHISLCKITRGARILKTKHSVCAHLHGKKASPAGAPKQD